MNTITEIIPDDLPDWAIEAMAEGRLFRACMEKEMNADDEIKAKMVEAIGWCWAEACSRAAKGEDICQTEVPAILDRAKQDLHELRV